MPGPLAGLKIIELAGIGPVPFAGMMLADNGAEIIRIERPGTKPDAFDVMGRSRKVIELDLKAEAGRDRLLELLRTADGLMEGFRPGVLERLGLHPERLLAHNRRLVIGRMTGWGQDGPYAAMAGHDLNYIAISGALHMIRRDNHAPAVPLNLIGDFGGGGMVLAFGMVSAIFAARQSGEGQVIDCAMSDGTAALMAMIMGFRNSGYWSDEPARNVLDSGAHFYNSYETSDGKFVAIASAEPQFYAELLDKLGLAEDPAFQDQHARDQWPALKTRLAEIFKTGTRDHWCEKFVGSDVCFAPVLTLAEVTENPHNKARGTYIEVDGKLQPAPVPRYSLTQNDKPFPARPAEASFADAAGNAD